MTDGIVQDRAGYVKRHILQWGESRGSSDVVQYPRQNGGWRRRPDEPAWRQCHQHVRCGPTYRHAERLDRPSFYSMQAAAARGLACIFMQPGQRIDYYLY